MSCLRSCAPARARAEFFRRIREQQAAEQAPDEPELIPEPAEEPDSFGV